MFQSAALFPIDFDNLESKRKFNNVLDLVGAFIEANDTENLFSYMQSPIQDEVRSLALNMPTLMQNLTTFEGPTIPGRINIMQAPRRILEGVPGLTPEYIEDILRFREYELTDPDFTDQNKKYATWIYVDQIVNLETMKLLMPYICTGGDVYQAEIVGYFADGAGTSRVEVVLDTTVPIPRILFWRDKSHLQGGYSIDALGTNLIE